MSFLLKGGTALIHGPDDHVQAVKTDILINGNRIKKIEIDISPAAGVRVIDCTDKVISPGFVDTHHHVWQTQLKGRHADQLLLDYMVSGNLQSSNFTPPDFFYGQLGGCLEALAAGTTTVIDHAHLNYSPSSSRLALAATISSGIRSIFCYCPTPRIASWTPFTMTDKLLEPWILQTLQELGKEAPWAGGRVQLGLAFDMFFLGKDAVVGVFEAAKAAGVKLITSHYSRNAQVGEASVPALLKEWGLLDEKILLSHASSATKEDAQLIRESGTHVSSTPSTELQMALGMPVCFRADMAAQCSLGVDCHANNAGSVVGEMRLGLQAARGVYNERFVEKGRAPREISQKVEEVFNLGTILGARALGMETEIGSLEVGKRADLCVFDGCSPAMVCASQHEPVAAVVMHSSPADVEMVVVDGVVRKEGGVLVEVEVEEGAREVVGRERLEWKDVARELVSSRREIQERIAGCDLVEGRKGMAKAWYIDESKIVDEI
ncbi:Metallo-dependent hydrolase [Lepidopterella palustris CBS 459.81]|uniref:Metallo-dependent hydrolase n=1 Tax=Lepidopterella palustris CBS 459.81 TaxID=1314670 RepID=A0A8E2EKV7_9PEZI|nr:Metallo-dependent hydrolase [Lepidopterella palustris CBS 459.81]